MCVYVYACVYVFTCGMCMFVWGECVVLSVCIVYVRVCALCVCGVYMYLYVCVVCMRVSSLFCLGVRSVYILGTVLFIR